MILVEVMMMILAEVMMILVEVMMTIDDYDCDFGVVENFLTVFRNLFRYLKHFLIQNVFFTPVHFIMTRVSVIVLEINKSPFFTVFCKP